MVTMSKKKPRPMAILEGNTSAEYWEQVLREEGLSMNAGLDPGHRKLLRVGNSTDLERIHAAIVTDTGKVKPEGHGPDDSDSE